MAKALKCDRCGKFFAYKDGIKKYRIRDMDNLSKNELDLCPDCYTEMYSWLTGEVGAGEFESKDCDNIKGERVIKCREESDGNSSS